MQQKAMTTKGLKFAINTNKALKALDDQMKQMMKMMNNMPMGGRFPGMKR